MTTDALVVIRQVSLGDVDLIVTLIKELAEYEKLSHECQADASLLEAALFCSSPKVFALVAEYEGIVVGFALYFYNYSTFLTRHGIYLEDIYVKPEYRGKGIGKRLLTHIAKIAVQEGCRRFEWWVLDWNSPSIEFYKSFGAKAMDEWTVYRVEGKALLELSSAYGMA